MSIIAIKKLIPLPKLKRHCQSELKNKNKKTKYVAYEKAWQHELKHRTWVITRKIKKIHYANANQKKARKWLKW